MSAEQLFYSKARKFLQQRLDALNEEYHMPLDRVPEWWVTSYAALLKWRQHNPTKPLAGKEQGCSVLPPSVRAEIASSFSAVTEDYFKKRRRGDPAIKDLPFPSDQSCIMGCIMNETEFAEIWNGYASSQYGGMLYFGGLVQEDLPASTEDQDVEFSFVAGEPSLPQGDTGLVRR